MERFLEVASQIDDGLSAYLVLSVITLDRGGWSEVPLRDMDLTEISQLVERLWDKLDEEVERELDVAIPEYFRRDDHAALSQMIASWHVNFEDEERRRVFEDALWAHKYRRYTLSILTLASQVEGVVRDLTGDYSEGGQWRKRFLDTIGYDPENPPSPSSTEELSEYVALPIHERYQSSEDLRKHFTLVRIHELFERKDFSDPRSASSINRHVILHGVFKNFGEIESLKLFFVLDLLHEAVGMYREREA